MSLFEYFCREFDMDIVTKFSYPTSHWKVMVLLLIPGIPIYLFAPAKWLYIFYFALLMISHFALWLLNRKNVDSHKSSENQEKTTSMDIILQYSLIFTSVFVCVALFPSIQILKTICAALYAALIFYTKPYSKLYRTPNNYLPEMVIGWSMLYLGIAWKMHN